MGRSIAHRLGRWGALHVLLIGAAACGGGAATGEGESGAGSSAEWPSELVTGDGSGPALYLSESADSPAVGYVSPGVVVRIGRQPVGDRVSVMVQGPLTVRGWLSLSRLAARITRGGRVRGTPTSVGVNDIVGVRGMSEPGILRVEVRPFLGRANAPSLGPFVGEYPVSRVGAAEVTAPDDAERGEPHALAQGMEVPLYSRPNGDVVATLPALDPPLVVDVVAEHGDWKAVRVGLGPYLIGYVNAPLTPAEAPEDSLEMTATGEASAIPERLAAESTRPLWRVPAGTRVRFNDKVVARFEQDGWAREMNRYAETDEVDVFVAVNDEVAVRGMVHSADLRAIEAENEPEPALPSAPPPATVPPPPPPTPAPAPAQPSAPPATSAPAPSGQPAPGDSSTL